MFCFYRKEYSDDLIAAGLKLDRRGGLFPDSPPVPHGSGNDLINFIKTYKFYMAFENQHHCRDYFTEKVWKNSLAAEAVPIVWGATRKVRTNINTICK